MDWSKYFKVPEKDDNEWQKFKKFDYEDDDDDFSDLDTFFNEFHGNVFGGLNPSVFNQFQEILEAMDKLKESGNDEQRRAFYDHFPEMKRDEDLDAKNYGERFNSLLKKITPNENKEIEVKQPARKLTDEEKIMDKIHGTFKEEVRKIPPRPAQRKGQVQKAPFSPHHHFGGFEAPSSPNSKSMSFGKTVISVRNSDGSYETRKIERMSDGTVKTTVTKADADGNKTKEVFSGDQQISDGGAKEILPAAASRDSKPHEERNLIVTNDGYKIPCLF